MINKKRLSGFTLIELLIVIAIIGLIASAIIVSFSAARKKARDARAKTDFEQMATAMEFYYTEYKHFFNTGNTSPALITSLQSEAGLGQYLKPIPMGSGVKKYYWCNPGGLDNPQTFCLVVELENPQGSNTYFYFSQRGSGYGQSMALSCPL